jgi:hypothetical protein
MSEHQQGPGWWQASDGRWYPPDQAPPVPPPETWAPAPGGPAPRSGLSTGAVIAIVIAAVVVVLVLVGGAVALVGTGSVSSSSDDADAPADGPVSTADPVDAPEGFRSVAGDGVAIAVPDRWLSVTTDDLEVSEDELAEQFPDADPAMLDEFSSLFAQGAVLVAADPQPEDGFGSNVNILFAPGSGSFDEIEPAVADQLATVGGEVSATREVDLPAGPALRVEYTIGDPDDRLEGTQYYVRSATGFYVVSVTAASGAGALADQMMETFSIDG